ncbi:homeobox-leucine zipper protein HOX6-like [Andrographis paniculata]|uniref:homeobox-leucine zipper protein HOX6-like n=1 Tax=Andrographis paniculata TaxID=175694 RepID=UPI0021E97589|nr:homeobox-leucine zipper protein HOX6-like [Andrographis paniculata]
MAKRFERRQIELLKMAFEDSEHLTKEKKLELSRATGLDMEQVASWFNRMRARKRARECRGDLNRINAELRELLRQCQEREARLVKELEESERREARLEDENRSLKHRIAVAEGDLRFDPLRKFIHGYM